MSIIGYDTLFPTEEQAKTANSVKIEPSLLLKASGHYFLRSHATIVLIGKEIAPTMGK